MFLEVLKLLGGLLLFLSALLAVILAAVGVSVVVDPGRSNRLEVRLYGSVFMLFLAMLSVLAGAGATYLIWDSIAAMLG
jgi:hypothetical protein